MKIGRGTVEERRRNSGREGGGREEKGKERRERGGTEEEKGKNGGRGGGTEEESGKRQGGMKEEREGNVAVGKGSNVKERHMPSDTFCR